MKQSTRFVTFTGHQWDGGFDALTDDSAQAIILQNLKRFFDIDFSKVIQISAWVECEGFKGMQLVFKLAGSVYRSVDIESTVCGQVLIDIESEQVFRHDPIRDLLLAWKQKLGLPKGFPVSEDIEIDLHGTLKIELSPAF